MEAKTYFDTFSKGFEDVFVKMVQTGKLSFRDLANTMIAEFARIESRKLFAGLFGGGSTGGGFFEGLFSGAKTLLSGNSFFKMLGFANGGVPPIGVPSIVGERGPELFVPRSAGTIIPNGQFGTTGMNTNITYNINATDAASFRQLLAREPEFLYAVTEKGRSAIPSGRR
jgi:phage-related minor tail protein